MISVLAKDRVIRSAFVFRVWLHVHGGEPIRAGVYRLRRHEPYGSVLAALAGPPIAYHLVIPEGLTLDQIANRVGRLPGHTSAGFLAAASKERSTLDPKGSHDLEGLLMPATYSVSPGEPDSDIVSQMVSAFETEADTIHLQARAAALGLTPYQAVTVASMIVREAGIPSDAAKVSRVIYNRLSAHMRLQIDATVLFALGRTSGSLTSTDLGFESPYNTYLHTGLPPTPIASPGRASLEAALDPAPGKWLYYVVVSRDGKEAFSTTLAGQEANIALARSRGLPG